MIMVVYDYSFDELVQRRKDGCKLESCLLILKVGERMNHNTASGK